MFNFINFQDIYTVSNFFTKNTNFHDFSHNFFTREQRLAIFSKIFIYFTAKKRAPTEIPVGVRVLLYAMIRHGLQAQGQSTEPPWH